MTKTNRIVGMVLLLLVGFVGGMVTVAGRVRPAQAAEPCRVEDPIPADPQLWLYRGIEFCETKCGKGVPFDVEVEPKRVRCNCGRPPNLGVKR
jgi:hypothetical protein